MAPYFETAKSFADVPITDDGVDTAAFMLASTDFLNMFDLLGSGVFGFVQTDLRNNLAGVRRRYELAPSRSVTLEKLATSEAEDKERHGTACLVRLIRGLLFTCQALQNMQSDKSSELHICFKRSYDTVLKHHHTFIIRSAVSMNNSACFTYYFYPTISDTIYDKLQVAIRAVPYRKDFYDRVTQGGSHERFDGELAKWLSGLEIIVNRLKEFLEQGGYGKV